MQPINSNERKKAFWNFLLLFIISIVIITTTIFFSIRVPFKQNDQLLKDMSAVERERDFSNKFMNQMSAVTTMLDTINTKATRPDVVDYEISENLKKLSLLVDSDSVYNKALYKNVVITLSDLSNAKKELREQFKKAATAGNIQAEKDELSRQVQSLTNENFGLKQQILMYQRQPR